MWLKVPNPSVVFEIRKMVSINLICESILLLCKKLVNRVPHLKRCEYVCMHCIHVYIGSYFSSPNPPHYEHFFFHILAIPNRNVSSSWMKYSHHSRYVATLLWECVRMKLTLPKCGFGSPLGLSKFQSLITRVKTPCIGVFFISLESYQSVNVENGSYGPFGIITIWLLTTKSRESTRYWCAQVECDTLLESSRGELQVCFRLHPNRRSEQGVLISRSLESPNRNNFRTLPWESQDKKPFRCGCRGEAQRILYGGRWLLPPNLGRGESCESRVARGLS
jgi:hypothetical protein